MTALNISRMKKAFAAFFLPLAITGCVTNESLEVGLANVSFAHATVFETSCTFSVRIDNPSPAALSLTGSSHRIYLNGLYVGTGLSDAAIDLPRLSSVTLPVSVHLSNLKLATRVKPIIESRSFDYRIQSTLYTQEPSRKIRARSTGRLHLQDFRPMPTSPTVTPLN